MSATRHRIPIESFYSNTTLFGDFATRPEGAVAGTLGRFDAGSPLWDTVMTSGARGNGAAHDRFFEALAAYNRDLGVGDDVTARLAEVASGRARVVITGQQPGVLGGPLMTLYKIETALALAQRLEETHGVPCVPVYWMGADDTDFAEVRELVMLNASHRALATSLPTGAHEVAMPVGDIDSKWVRQLWNGIDAFVGGFDGGEPVIAAVTAALEGAADHGDVAARVVTALTGGQVAVVDARDGLLREAASEVILDYFDREDGIKQAVEDGGRALEAAGFHAQLSLGPDSGVFILENGRRTKVTTEQRSAARSRIESQPACAYPGVVLRNMVQDAVFDPAAVVLGPAEIAYRAQIRGAYDLMGMTMPVSFPRLFATYLPPDIAAMLDAVGADATRLVIDTGEFVKEVFASQTDPRLEAARRDIEAAFSAQAESFLATAKETMEDADLGKMRKRLADVARRLSQAVATVSDAGRTRALERWPFLDGLTDVFQRRGGAQERYLSMLAPFLFGGCTSDECIRDVARAHVEAALDGHVEHIVYSD